MTLEELITESIHDNAAAQKQLFDLYYPRALIYCILQLKNHHDAEDVAMTGIHYFFRYLHHFRYKGAASVFAWLKTILRNECKKLRHSQPAYWNFALVPELMEMADQEAPIEKVEATELLSIIRHITKEYLAVFTCYELDGMSHKQIAAEFGITEGSSRMYLTRAKKEIQTLLNRKAYLYEK